MRSLIALALCVTGSVLAQDDGLPPPALERELHAIVQLNRATKVVELYGISGLGPPLAPLAGDALPVEPVEQASHLARFQGFRVTVRARPVIEGGRITRLRVAAVTDPVLRTDLVGRVVSTPIHGNNAPQLGFVVAEKPYGPWTVDVPREVHDRLGDGEVVRFDAWVFGDFDEGLLLRLHVEPGQQGAQAFGQAVAKATGLQLRGSRALSLGTPTPTAHQPGEDPAAQNGPVGRGLEAQVSGPQVGSWVVRRLRFASADAAFAHAEDVFGAWNRRLGLEPGSHFPRWAVIEAHGAEVVVAQTDYVPSRTPDFEALRLAAWGAGAAPQGARSLKAIAGPESLSAVSWRASGRVRGHVTSGLEAVRGWKAQNRPGVKIELLAGDSLRYERQHADGMNTICYLRLEKQEAEFRRALWKPGADGWVPALDATQLHTGMARVLNGISPR